jgi:regulator of sigma E protease
MSWLLTILGFCVLIVLHEFGHFAAAKLTGMRVERFLLFFPPVLAKVRRGETEYGIGAIPLGGMVKITGMDPRVELPEDVRPRAYHAQPVWKRIVVIAAGPAMNLLLAFLILWALFLANGSATTTKKVDAQGLRAPAAEVLRPGDRVVAVDGKRGSQETIALAVARHRCAGKPANGCQATTPATVTVVRDGQVRTFTITPRYDAAVGRTRLGFTYEVQHHDVGPVGAARESINGMWRVTKLTVSAVARIFQPEQRKQLSSVVGASKVTEQAFNHDLTDALSLLALISLSLAIINLFPFLPLDGGHIFWALVEKARGGRPVPFEVVERASVIGFALVLTLFFIGLSNDINRLQGAGFPSR